MLSISPGACRGVIEFCALCVLLVGCSSSTRNYDAFWSDLDERYALFDIRLPADNWSALRDVHAPTTSGKDDLFDAMISLARELDDGHVTLRGTDAWVSAYPHYDTLERLEINAEEHYLDEPLTWDAQDWFAWGRSGSVGYLSITSMDGLSQKETERADVDAAELALGRALADLSDTTALIVDVRANEGGWDAVSLALANAFAGPRALAWSEQTRDGPRHDDFSPWRDVFVEASSGYDRPVAVLTSGGTFSAAETFALAMRVRPHVTLLGEPTSGHFSDLEDGQLPNGWNYTFSAERYRAADGEIYEARGVPVDLAIPLDPEAVDAGRDAILEAALGVAR